MKKQFIKPKIQVIELLPQTIIAESLQQLQEIDLGTDGKGIDITDIWN